MPASDFHGTVGGFSLKGLGLRNDKPFEFRWFLPPALRLRQPAAYFAHTVPGKTVQFTLSDLSGEVPQKRKEIIPFWNEVIVLENSQVIQSIEVSELMTPDYKLV
ncbi:MAG: hypothetical protein HY774_02605 [Acidobacteria bacterium]|nr:hypothetical protein [Acidobacteriota bacterium]